jgi:preprotein translocase subunit SecD
MIKKRLLAIGILIISVALGFFVFAYQSKPFTLGLDLSGGTHLVYEADVSLVESENVDDAMQVLRTVVLRRINSKQVAGALGVLEPLVQVKSGGIGAGDSQQLIVDLPGVTDVATAEAAIGKTPTLDFRLEGNGTEPQSVTVGPDGTVDLGSFDPFSNYKATGLTGRFLDTARVEFDQTTGMPLVSLKFNDDGAKLFAEITRSNIGKRLAIFLDGVVISSPTIQQEITGGEAVISGTFNLKEAKELAGSLSYGALPVPVKLISSELIGPTLGAEALQAGLLAGIIGFIAIGLFLTLWYRLPGLVATIALAVYVVITLAVFKALSVTLSSAAIAGFIISIGIAVDANVLIFERMKEERRNGLTLAGSATAGFARAWLSIRDSNFSSMITALILFFVFETSFVRGFAITFFFGVLISMFSSMVVTRMFVTSIAPVKENRFVTFLFGSGFSFKNN